MAIEDTKEQLLSKFPNTVQLEALQESNEGNQSQYGLLLVAAIWWISGDNFIHDKTTYFVILGSIVFIAIIVGYILSPDPRAEIRLDLNGIEIIGAVQFKRSWIDLTDAEIGSLPPLKVGDLSPEDVRNLITKWRALALSAAYDSVKSPTQMKDMKDLDCEKPALAVSYPPRPVQNKYVLLGQVAFGTLGILLLVGLGFAVYTGFTEDEKQHRGTTIEDMKEQCLAGRLPTSVCASLLYPGTVIEPRSGVAKALEKPKKSETAEEQSSPLDDASPLDYLRKK